jgi:transcriptional regulator with XRE-family HTH domain
MSERSERLKAARIAAGFKSTEEVAKRLGMSASTYRAHENGQNDFDHHQVSRYAKLFKTTPAKLSFGNDFEPLKIDTYDPDAAEPPAEPDDQMTVGEHTGMRGAPMGSTAQLDVTAGLGAGGVLLDSGGVPGKYGMTFAAEHVRDYWRLPPAVLGALGVRSDDIVFFPVQGDSMQPTLMEGELVVVDTRHRWPSPDGIYALTDTFGGIVVKRLQVASKPTDEEQLVDVMSDNPRHGTKRWKAEEIRIIGRVVRKFGIVQ